MLLWQAKAASSRTHSKTLRDAVCTGAQNAHRLLPISSRWLIQPHASVLECLRLDAALVDLVMG